MKAIEKIDRAADCFLSCGLETRHYGRRDPSDAFAVAVFEDVGLVFSLLHAGDSNLIEIAVALCVVIVGGQIEDRCLHENCLCPVQGILLRNAVGISHVVLHSPNHKGLAEFYQQALGFRLSDWIGDFMVFLRRNSAHHRLAILPGPPALNHIAFDVDSVDELMRGLARMHESGIKLSWGPGRHTAGDNTFCYFISPNGNVVEYTSDLEHVDEASWVPTTYEPGPNTIDQWGTGRIITGNVPHAEMTPDKGLWQVPA